MSEAEDTAQRPAAPAGAVERRESGRLYGRTATELTGAVELAGAQVRYRDALTRRQRWGVVSLGWFHVVLTLALTGYLLAPGNLPWLGSSRVPWRWPADRRCVR